MKWRMVKITLVFSLLVLLFGAAVPVLADESIEVIIDIKPCKDPNMLNVNVIGWLPVAIYEKEVDPELVELEGAPAVEWINKGDYWLVKFDAEAVISTFGEVEDGDVLELTLDGELNDGTPIVGYDNVVILKRGKK